jgi:hypothetical protein
VRRKRVRRRDERVADLLKAERSRRRRARDPVRPSKNSGARSIDGEFRRHVLSLETSFATRDALPGAARCADRAG